MILANVKPLNRWDYSSIQPGAVGSVGDVNLTPRLKSSLPGDFRWESCYDGEKESLFGSSITDGQQKSFNTGAIGNRVIDRTWAGGRQFQTGHGWYYQDLRVPDKRIEPVMGTLPQYDWRNKIAAVNNAGKTGNLFQYNGAFTPPNGPLRGGLYPSVTAVEVGVPNFAPMMSFTPLPPQKAVVAGRIMRQMI